MDNDMNDQNMMREAFEKNYKYATQLLNAYTFDNGDFQYHTETVHSHWVGFKQGWNCCRDIYINKK